MVKASSHIDGRSGRSRVDGGVGNDGNHEFPRFGRRRGFVEGQPRLQGRLADERGVRRRSWSRQGSYYAPRPKPTSRRTDGSSWRGRTPAGEKQVQAVLGATKGCSRPWSGGRRPGRSAGARDRHERFGAASSRRCAGAQGEERAAGGADPGSGGRFLRPGTDRSSIAVSGRWTSAHGNDPAA